MLDLIAVNDDKLVLECLDVVVKADNYELLMINTDVHEVGVDALDEVTARLLLPMDEMMSHRNWSQRC